MSTAILAILFLLSAALSMAIADEGKPAPSNVPAAPFGAL